MSVSKTSKSFAVKEAKKPFETYDFDLRPLGPNDVELKVTHCGVCHSDLHTVDGDWGPQPFPIVPGHEIVGYVTEVGEKVKHVTVGQRIGVGPQALSCFSCKQCERKTEMYCPKKLFTYGGKHADGYVTKGGYAEFHRVHERFCFAIPENLSSEHAAPLLCAGITVFSPLKHFGVGPGTRVGIIGIGGLGHLAVQYAAALGAHVTALSSSDNKKEEALKFGAKEFVVTSNPENLKKLANSFDFILNTVSAHMDWAPFIAALDADGTFCDVGAPEGSFRVSVAPSTLFMKRIKITGSLVGSPDEFEPMLEFSAKHNCLPLIEVVPWEKVNEIADKVRQNKIRYRGVLEIDPKYKPKL